MSQHRGPAQLDEGETGSPVLSPLDYRIFTDLQRNGRTPYTTLAESLGVSEAYIRKRVRYLTEADFFSITAVANPRVLGLEYMAWVGFVVRNSATGRVAEALVELPEVNYVVICSGAFNVMAEVACRTHVDLYRLLTTLRAIRDVQRTETFIYLKLLRQRFQWMQETEASKSEALSSYVVEATTTLEPIDIEIIRELEKDGRAPFRRIAHQLGVSERTVSARVGQLTDCKVLQTIAVGNPLTMGFEAMAWLGITLSENAQPEAVTEALAAVPGVCYVVVASGRFDIMVELVCRTRSHLLDTLERRIGAIPDIAHVESFYYLRLLYRSTAGGWGAARSLAAPKQPGLKLQQSESGVHPASFNGRRT